MSDLFRQEVIERQTNRLHGDILVLPRMSHGLILGFLLFWLALAAYWLTTSTYARKETVLGWLEPAQGVTRVYATDAGTIKQVLVEEGQMVLEGQPLLIVNGDRYLADGEQLEQRLLEEYQAQRRMLDEQLQRGESIFHRRKKDLHRQIEASEQDIGLLADQLQTLNQRHALIKELVERNQTLQNQGFVSSTDLENIINQELGLRHEKQALMREELNRRNTLEQLKTELDLLPEEYANEAGQLRARLSDVAQKIAQLHGQRAYVLKASRGGEVNNLQARPGTRVNPGGSIPLLSILPAGQELSAQLLIPVRSAGFVEPGQSLDIRFDAFPYQKFGLYHGEVAAISDSVLMPNELLNVPLEIREPVYRVTATLADSRIEAYGRQFPLKAGMTLSADVRLGERTLLQWLLEPLYSLKGRL